MKTNIKVCDVMTRKPISVDRTMSLQVAAKTMREHEIGSVVVLENKKLVGFVTLQEFVYRAIALGVDTKVATIEDIMARRSDVVTVSPSADLGEAIELINKNNVRQLPVIDPVDDKLVGLVTIKDILRLEPDLFELMTERISMTMEESDHHPVFATKYASGLCSSCGKYADHLIDRAAGMQICPSCRIKE